MPRARPVFPPLTAVQLSGHFFDLVQLIDRKNVDQYPLWLRNVWKQLRQQLLPPELDSLVSPNGEFFAIGLAVGVLPLLQNFVPLEPEVHTVITATLEKYANLVGDPFPIREFFDGSLLKREDVKTIVIEVLTAKEIEKRRMFSDGLSVGVRFQELVEKANRKTEATDIYILLWLYWREVDKMRSIPDVARAIEGLYGQNKTMLGAAWEERFRKLANRIELSYVSKRAARSAQAPENPDIDRGRLSGSAS